MYPPRACDDADDHGLLNVVNSFPCRSGGTCEGSRGAKGLKGIDGVKVKGCEGSKVRREKAI